VQTEARADARRNRAKVLQAAGDAFAREGSGASLDRIAALAGLGAGTIYRHFPTKESLLEAVVVQRVDEVVARGLARRAEQAPGPAFFGFLNDVVQMSGSHRGVCDALTADGSWPRVAFQAAGHRFDSALVAMLRAAQQVGSVRVDADAADVRTLLAGCAVMVQAGPRSERLVRRVLDVLRPSVTERALRDGAALCAMCGAEFHRAPTGRPARYCGPACRQRAHRMRATGERFAPASLQ
jgi:AcrR family transcriptional regulator